MDSLAFGDRQRPPRTDYASHRGWQEDSRNRSTGIRPKGRELITLPGIQQGRKIRSWRAGCAWKRIGIAVVATSINAFNLTYGNLTAIDA